MNKLLLVDGSALLHRAYHAYPPLTSKTGEVVGAVYGVASILISALESEKPDYVMVAWDLPKPTFRHAKYVGYKAQRPKADEEMVSQIPKVKEIIASMGIVQVEQEGYEADDIIGTLSKLATESSDHSPTFAPACAGRQGSELRDAVTDVVILTGDQDTMQLVSEQVKVLTPAKGANQQVLYGPEEVFGKYGVHPNQIVDYKALIGDPSDNIPGVSGIGPTTASKLLQEFDNLQAIYKAVNSKSQIPNLKLKEKLINGKESAFLSQDLSRIVVDMKLNVQMEEMEYKGLQGQALQAKLEELGFKSLVKRLFGPTSPMASLGVTNQMGLF